VDEPAPLPIYLAGPTATGKSELAVRLAEQLGGEIVGADAFQVYEGLNLLTAKPEANLLARCPHHLVGVVPLDETFDVATYLERSKAAIEAIRLRKKLPIIVGGTGLYVRALTHGLAELPQADATLRAKLEARSLAQLQSQLHELDPQCAAVIDLKNPRRVIRALEVCLLSGRPFSSFREQTKPVEEVRGIRLIRNRESLYQRIDQRTQRMFTEGVVEEVRAVREISSTARQAIGFEEIRALFRGELDEADCIAAIQQQTRNYAKRQMTWFRRETGFSDLSLDDHNSKETVIEEILRRFRL
jgi:tRNA dimethylallyltransferase